MLWSSAEPQPYFTPAGGTQQSWLDWAALEGAPCCLTGCPSTHTHGDLHTSLWSQCPLSARARVAQNKMGAILVTDQTRTNRHTKHSHMRWHWHTRPHTIHGAQYRVHYFGMPHCFPLNTRCTQTSLGLTGMSHTGLQQTNMIAWLPVWLHQVHVKRTEWLTSAQDYPNIKTHSLSKYGSVIAAELSFTVCSRVIHTVEHVTRTVSVRKHAFMPREGGFPAETLLGLSFCKKSNVIYVEYSTSAQEKIRAHDSESDTILGIATGQTEAHMFTQLLRDTL